MKASLAAAWVAVNAGVALGWEPRVLNVADLASGAADQVVSEQLGKVGLVQVNGLDGLAELRKATFESAVACAAVSEHARSVVFGEERDVVRTTMALESRAGFSQPQGEFEHEHAPCQAFDSASHQLRQLVDQAAREFSRSVSRLAGDSFVLWRQTNDDVSSSRSSYSTFYDAAFYGHHLEHFHAYQRVKEPSSAQTPSIDLHTDQGLFIAIVPPLMVESGKRADLAAGEFLIEMGDGSSQRVDWSDDGDVVAFMLGDGMNQVGLGEKFRPVPHAVVLPSKPSRESYRVWYGRMFLAPSDAELLDGSMTFGALRTQMASSVGQLDSSSAALPLGCSGHQTARELAAADCAESEEFCWYRCQAIGGWPTYETEESCASSNKTLNCAAFDGTLVPGNKHGDYFLNCTAKDAANYTAPEPAVWPTRSATCQDVDGQINGMAGDFDGFRKLNDQHVVFFKNVSADGVKVRLVYIGAAGWLSIGIPSEDGSKKGMAGGKVVFGRMSNLIETSSTPYVGEFQIPYNVSAKRWWTTLPNEASETKIAYDGCSTILEFTTKSIGGVDFVPGNDIIWASNPTTDDDGYHGRATRGRVPLAQAQEQEGVGSFAASSFPSLLLVLLFTFLF